MTPPRPARGLATPARWLPLLRWLPAYRRRWLPADLAAGLALWAVMVPEGMAYAGIVGVPPIMGLYTLVPPLVAYALLGTSRRLVIGPDTATGLISALTVGALAAQGSTAFNELTGTLAVLIGVLFLLLGLLRMGWVAAFIPTPVMRGFIEGLVLVTIVGQVPHLLGLPGGSGHFFDRVAAILRQLPEIRLAPAATGLLALAAMVAMRRLAPRLPAALIVAAAATLAVALVGGAAAGIDVVGALPSGVPHLVLPRLDPALLRELAPGALAIVLLGYAEALGAATAAADPDETIEPNQELVAHGPANILSGLFGGFLAVGSLSKTSVALSAGGRSQLASLVAAALCFLTLLWLTPLFHDMPHAGLAAIVIAAMLHLQRPGYVLALARRSRGELAVAIVVFAGELTLGVLQGIGLGVALSLLVLVYRTTHPNAAVLGQLPGEQSYRDLRRHPEARTFPGLLIWRPGGDLFFASIGRVVSDLEAAVAATVPPPSRVLLDASSVDFVDTTACDALLKLIAALRERGVTVAMARVRDEVRLRLARSGIEAAIGPGAFYERITDGVRAWQESQARDEPGA
jgi:high affinity sulfate transporter 1